MHIVSVHRGPCAAEGRLLPRTNWPLFAVWWGWRADLQHHSQIRADCFEQREPRAPVGDEGKDDTQNHDHFACITRWNAFIARYSNPSSLHLPCSVKGFHTWHYVVWMLSQDMKGLVESKSRLTVLITPILTMYQQSDEAVRWVSCRALARKSRRDEKGRGKLLQEVENNLLLHGCRVECFRCWIKIFQIFASYDIDEQGKVPAVRVFPPNSV